MTISRNTLQSRVLTAAAIAVLATSFSLPAGAESEIIYEFPIIPGENGQPDFGIALYVVASPDGRFVYVITAPPFESLRTFERVGQNLVLRNTFTSGDDGVGFLTVALEITDDGRYLLVGSFALPVGVQVFELDAETGLPAHVQTITHPDLDTVDGVDAAFDAIVSGRRPFPETGSVAVTLRRTSLATKRYAPRLGQVSPPFAATRSRESGGAVISSSFSQFRSFPSDPAEFPVFSSAFAQLIGNEDDPLIPDKLVVEDDLDRVKSFMWEDLVEAWKEVAARGAVPFDHTAQVRKIEIQASSTQPPIVTFYFVKTSDDVAIAGEADARLDLSSCQIVDPGWAPPIRRTSDPSIARSSPTGPRNTVVDVVVGTDGTEDENQVLQVRFLDGDSDDEDDDDDDDARFGDDEESANFQVDVEVDRTSLLRSLAVVYYDPEKGPRGRPNGVGVTALLPGGPSSVQARRPSGGSQTPGVLTAYIYTIVPNPPAIHAFRYTTDELGAGGCIANATTACLNDHAITVEWSDFSGNGGPAQVVPGGSNDSGLFTFFDADNWELLVKVLDGCDFNGHYWVFSAGTTNAGVSLQVENLESGEIVLYDNPRGLNYKSVLDTQAVSCGGRGGAAAAGRNESQRDGSTLPTVLPAYSPPALDFAAVAPAGACRDSDTGLCLNESRYLVEVEWWDFKDNHGSGQVVPLRSSDSGLFWFFDAGNWELLVKVLDGCGVNGHHWVFAAATTNVGYSLTVTDTVTGAVRQYENGLGEEAQALADLEAFASCN